MQKKHGFTLVELLVVIAIIGILAGILAPRLLGTMDSAKEQHCRNNLRKLHNAVLQYSTDRADDKGAPMPAAQCFEIKSVDWEREEAWVSWVPIGSLDEEPFRKLYDQAGRSSSSHEAEMGDDLGHGDECSFAIRHGLLFPYIGDEKSYRCPVTAVNADKFMNEGAKADIRRTYAMGNFFRSASNPRRWRANTRDLDHLGIDEAPDGGSVAPNGGLGKGKQVIFNFDAPRFFPTASRLLLFSEVLPSPDGTAISPRSSSGLGARSPHDGCIAPDKWSSIAFSKKSIRWSGKVPGSSSFTLGIPTTEMLYGLHEPFIHYTQDDVWIGSGLAVFCDGRIEKVTSVPLTGVREANASANTAWFLNNGLRPGTEDPF